MSPELRERVGQIGVDAARAVGYVGAGTVEGLLVAREDGGFDYFFLEMNTRVQVEHSVTEMTTGVDIVKQGIRAAAGERLPLAQRDVSLRGHAIECRINAEDAARNFAPAPGRIGRYREPGRSRRAGRFGRRSRSGGLGDVRPARGQADRLGRGPRAGHRAHAQGPLRIRARGPDDAHTLPRGAARSEQWARGETCRDLLEDSRWLAATALPAGGRAAPEPERRGRADRADLHGRGLGPALRGAGDRPASPGSAASGAEERDSARTRRGRARAALARRHSLGSERDTDVLESPLQGSMWKVLVKQGDTVQEGQLLCIIEAMKMENEITAHKAGKIVDLPISEGAAVAVGAPLATIKSD